MSGSLHDDEMPEKPDRPSDEMIAALIDGRLSDEKRRSVMQALGQSDEDLERMLDAASAVSHLRAGEEGIRDLADARKRRSQWRVAAFVGMSAAAAALAVITLRTPGGPAGEPYSAAQMVESLADRSVLPADWNYTPWPPRRGETVQDSSRIYVRIGVRSVDIEVAANARDSVLPRLAFEMAALLAQVPGGSPAGAVYRRIGDEGGNALMSQAREALRTLGNTELVERGAWLEAARIAAERKDSAWFASEMSERVLGRVTADKTAPPPARAAAGELGQAIKGSGVIDWALVISRVESILAQY